MKIRALRTLRTDAGNVRRGQEVELSGPSAKSLIARGIAEPVDEKDDPSSENPKPTAPAKPKPHVKSRSKKPAEGASAPKGD